MIKNSYYNYLFWLLNSDTCIGVTGSLFKWSHTDSQKLTHFILFVVLKKVSNSFISHSTILLLAQALTQLPRKATLVICLRTSSLWMLCFHVVVILVFRSGLCH